MCLLNKYGAHPGPRPKSLHQCAETFSTLPFQCNFPAPSAESTSLGEKRFRRPPHLLILPYRLLSPSPNHLGLSLNDAEPCSAPPDPTTWETQPPSILAPAPPLRLGIEVAERQGGALGPELRLDPAQCGRLRHPVAACGIAARAAGRTCSLRGPYLPPGLRGDKGREG